MFEYSIFAYNGPPQKSNSKNFLSYATFDQRSPETVTAPTPNLLVFIHVSM